MKKIAFTGTSGSGKTTLVKFIHEDMGIPHLDGSSGRIKTEEDRKFLKESFGFEGEKGHAHVIQESHKNPALGEAIQNIILNRRRELIQSTQDFVTDRSPLDSFIYYLFQTGLYQGNFKTQSFMKQAIEDFSKLSHVIYVPAMLLDIEDNNSRIANYYYQRGIDAAFNSYWQVFTHHAKIINPSIQMLKITEVDLKKRQAIIVDFIKKG